MRACTCPELPVSCPVHSVFALGREAAEMLLAMPNDERESFIEADESAVLAEALEIVKARSAAYVAADIAYELGRRGFRWPE